DKLVLLQTVSFRSKKDYNAHRLLRAIDNNTLLSKLSKTEEGQYSQQMFSPEIIKAEFEDYPFILENTKHLIKNCKIEFGFGPARMNRNLQVNGESNKEDEELLKQLCRNNLPKRKPNASEVVFERVDKEPKAIIGLGFVSYFLI